MCTSNDGWEYVLEKRGVQLYRRAAESVNHLKGVMKIPFSPRQVSLSLLLVPILLLHIYMHKYTETHTHTHSLPLSLSLFISFSLSFSFSLSLCFFTSSKLSCK